MRKVVEQMRCSVSFSYSRFGSALIAHGEEITSRVGTLLAPEIGFRNRAARACLGSGNVVISWLDSSSAVLSPNWTEQRALIETEAIIVSERNLVCDLLQSGLTLVALARFGAWPGLSLIR